MSVVDCGFIREVKAEAGMMPGADVVAFHPPLAILEKEERVSALLALAGCIVYVTKFVLVEVDVTVVSGLA